MNLGTGAYTNFKHDGSIVKAYNAIGDDDLESLTGFCHSHHNMQAYFSTTDMKELEDNAEAYYFYISLVVNTSAKYACKIIFPSNSESKYTFRNKDGELLKFIKTSKDYLEGDLEIVFESKTDVSDWVKNRFLELKTKSQTVTTFSPPMPNKQLKIDYDDDNYYKHPTKSTTTNIDSVQFLNAILTLDTEAKIDINNNIKELILLDTDQFNEYLYALANNIDIIHDFIYPDTFFLFNAHIKAILPKLDSYKTDNIIALKTFLTDLIK